jgi:hypothetical protein
MDGNLSDAHPLQNLEMVDHRPIRRLNSSYNKHSPATSIDRGVFVSATWGRHGGDYYRSQYFCTT